MNARLVALGCGLALAFVPKAAHALGQCGAYEDGVPIAGTVPAGLIGGAVSTNATTYGAAAMAERQILPALAHREGLVVRYEFGDHFGVLRAPMCVGDHVEMGKVDLSGGGFSFGYRTGPLSFYLVGSGAAHTIGTKVNERIGSAFFGIGLAQFSPAAFIKRDWSRENGSMSVMLDAMVGTQLATSVGTLNLAYLASQGIYTNVSLARVHAFAGAVVRTQKDELEDQAKQKASALLDQIPYARLGFVTMDWLTHPVEDVIGTTSLYARRLRYPSLPRSTSGAGDAAAQTASAAFPFTTTHLDQFGIGKLVDLSVAMAWQPEPYLHEASLGVRFGDPLPQDVALAKQEDKRGGGSEEAQGVRVMLGVIRPPTRWYYGVDGGYRLRASVEASAGSGAGFFSARFGVNTPETLTLYPYAMNAAELYVSGSYTN